jgi:hypothetical protein
MRHTIAAEALAPDTQPFVDDGCEDRRKGGADGYPARLPTPGRRGSTRRRVLLSALIVDLKRESISPCRIENVSDKGARIRLAAPCFVPRTFWVIALTRGLAYKATIVWRRNDLMGVSVGDPVELDDPANRVERMLHRIWMRGR